MLGTLRTQGSLNPHASCPAQLADGTELLGAYQGAGSRQVPYLVRRCDGTLLQVPRLTYAVAAHADGQHSLSEIATLAGEDLGRAVTADNVVFLLQEKLGPAGLLRESPPRRTVSPSQPALLSLSLRTKVLPERWVAIVARVLQPLFWLPVVTGVMLALVAVTAWLFLEHGVGPAVTEAIATPALLLVVGGLTVFAAAFHELGHATASRYGGARPGVIGVGLYLIWPAFFNDLTDSYRLSRRGRLRADLGGVYFNAVFVVLLAGAYAWTAFEPLLVAILIQYVVVFHQFLPFLRMDGYYLVSDVAGVPDLFARIKPVLSSLIPGRNASAALSDLKPRVRWVVAGWVLLTVPALLGGLVLLVARTPVAVAVGRASFATHTHLLGAAWRAGDTAAAAVSALQVAVLVLPLVGVTATCARLLARVTRRNSAAATRSSAEVAPSAADAPRTSELTTRRLSVAVPRHQSPQVPAGLIDRCLATPPIWMHRPLRCPAPGLAAPWATPAVFRAGTLCLAAFPAEEASASAAQCPIAPSLTLAGELSYAQPGSGAVVRASDVSGHERWLLHPKTEVLRGAGQPLWAIRLNSSPPLFVQATSTGLVHDRRGSGGAGEGRFRPPDRGEVLGLEGPSRHVRGEVALPSATAADRARNLYPVPPLRPPSAPGKVA